MHGVRRELVEQQASSIGLPLRTIEVPQMPGMQVYEDAVRAVHRRLAADGFTHGLFGDIFLEDLKAYREELLFEDGLDCLFPIWKEDPKALLRRFIDSGFKAIIVCVNASFLGEEFCGRLLDDSFVNDLPANVDPCGENGEYHSFVFDGPMFSTPVAHKKGGVVFKEYPSPKIRQVQGDNDDCFIAPQPASGFFFQDLITG